MIYFDITGNGTAYCIPSNPTIGETFEFFATPYDSDVFEDVTCTDENGYSIAVPQADNFTLEMPNTAFITFHVQFSGSTPPTPPTPTRTKRKHMPLWMYPMFRG